MKKLTLYIFGGLIILVLISIWVYLLFYGTPESVDDVFTDLGFARTEEGSIDTPSTPPQELEPTPTVATTGQPLQQLTTRSVTGFRTISKEGGRYIYYVEKGTGHIFRIDLQTGQETRISATTIPLAHDAHISPDGSVVAVRSRYGADSEVIVGRLSTTSDTFDIAVLDELVGEPVFDIHIGRKNELLFSVKDTNGTDGAVLDLNSFSTRQLFRVPLPDVRIVWGNEAAATHYIYTPPSELLSGYMYKIDTPLTPVPLRGNGLIATANEGWISSTFYTGDTYETTHLNLNTGEQLSSPVTVFPEKCVYDRSQPSVLYCGQNISLPPGSYPDDWYQGVVTFSDSLWQVSLIEEEATLLVNIEAESGRPVDINSIAHDPVNNTLYFTNKLDNSLWRYQISQ